MLSENDFDYVCVSRSKLKNYTIDPNSLPVEIQDKKKQKIQLQKVVSEKHNNFFLKIDSQAKRAKEVSMNNRFQEGFEKGLSIIAASLEKKSGIKTEEKVYGGTYFLRTSLEMSEEMIWMIYNIIREIEYSFRTLKTDLDLRPIYHKKDNATMAHLHLGLLAYWVVNTVRYQLKMTENETDKKQKIAENETHTEPINFQWKEIIRIMNTQKSVLTVSQNRYDEVIISRRCSDPTPKVEATYHRLKYKAQPFTKRKSVVHKSVFEKMDVTDLQKLVT